MEGRATSADLPTPLQTPMPQLRLLYQARGQGSARVFVLHMKETLQANAQFPLLPRIQRDGGQLFRIRRIRFLARLALCDALCAKDDLFDNLAAEHPIQTE